MSFVSQMGSKTSACKKVLLWFCMTLCQGFFQRAHARAHHYGVLSTVLAIEGGGIVVAFAGLLAFVASKHMLARCRV